MSSYGYANPNEEAETIAQKVDNTDVQYRTKIIVISSTDRNRDEFPEPNDYKIHLRDDFTDVYELQLLEATVPASQYNVNSNNNVFYFSEKVFNANGAYYVENVDFRDDNIFKIELPVGNYVDTILTTTPDKDQLATTLTTEMNLLGTNIYEVSYDSFTDKYLFTAIPAIGSDEIVPYNILFQGQEVPYGAHSYDKVIKRDRFDAIVYDSEGNKQYETVYVGKKDHKFRKKGVGKLLGFSNKNYNGNLHGKVSSNTANDKLIDGEFTHFTNDLVDGQWITIVAETDAGIQLFSYEIDQVVDDHSILVLQSIITTFTDADVYSANITPQFTRNLYPCNPVVLRIPRCKRLYSNNPIIHDGYTLFGNVMTSTGNAFYSDENQVISKKFNPILGSLGELYIRFYNTEQEGLYDFNGKEHKLVFKVTYLAQSFKYHNEKIINN
jgi:hypothetical protein